MDAILVGREQELVEHLKVAGLNNLLERIQSLDLPIDWNWYVGF